MSFADVILIDYAGHGTRVDETLNKDFDELIYDVSCIIKERIQDWSSVKISDRIKWEISVLAEVLDTVTLGSAQTRGLSL